MFRVVLGVLAIFVAIGCSGPKSPSPERSETIIRGINYVGLTVSDLDRSSAFYAGAADLKLVDEANLADSHALDSLAGREGVTVQTRLLRSVNAQVRLMKFGKPGEQALSTLRLVPDRNIRCLGAGRAVEVEPKFGRRPRQRSVSTLCCNSPGIFANE